MSAKLKSGKHSPQIRYQRRVATMYMMSSLGAYLDGNGSWLVDKHWGHEDKAAWSGESHLDQ